MSSSTLGRRLSCKELKQSLLLHVHLDGTRVETERSSPAGDSWSLITINRFLEAQASSGHTHKSISGCLNCRNHRCSQAGKKQLCAYDRSVTSPPGLCSWQGELEPEKRGCQGVLSLGQHHTWSMEGSCIPFGCPGRILVPRMVNPASVNHTQLLEFKAGWRQQWQPGTAMELCQIVSFSRHCPARPIPFVSGAACDGTNCLFACN